MLMALGITCAYASSTRAGRTYAHLRALDERLLVYAVRSGNPPRTREELSSLVRSQADWFRKRDLIDAWQVPVNYRFPSASEDRAFDLYSSGPDRIDNGGEGDDIVPWEYRGYYATKSGADTWIAAALLLDGPILLLLILVRRTLRGARSKQDAKEGMKERLSQQEGRSGAVTARAPPP